MRDLLRRDRRSGSRPGRRRRSPRRRCRRAARSARRGTPPPGRSGARATSADSSRTKSTRSSARTAMPAGASRGRAGRLARRTDGPDALAVVPAARGLEDDREAADRLGERDDVRGVGDDRACAGSGTPSSSSRRRITALSCAWTRAPGPGRAAMPSAASASRRPVGTCSWSNVTTAQPSAHAAASRVGVVADLGVGDDLGRRPVGGLGEQPQRDTQGDRRLLHHPGELAGADDTDHGVSTAQTLATERTCRGGAPVGIDTVGLAAYACLTTVSPSRTPTCPSTDPGVDRARPTARPRPRGGEVRRDRRDRLDRRRRPVQPAALRRRSRACWSTSR